MPGNEDYRQFRASLNEALIEFKAWKPGKTDVENETGCRGHCPCFLAALQPKETLSQRNRLRRIRWSEYLETIARDADESRFGRPS
jgi:hypothetical protein